MWYNVYSFLELFFLELCLRRVFTPIPRYFERFYWTSWIYADIIIQNIFRGISSEISLEIRLLNKYQVLIYCIYFVEIFISVVLVLVTLVLVILVLVALLVPSFHMTDTFLAGTNFQNPRFPHKFHILHVAHYRCIQRISDWTIVLEDLRNFHLVFLRHHKLRWGS